MLEINYFYNNFEKIISKLKTRTINNEDLNFLKNFKINYENKKNKLLLLEKLSHEKNSASSSIANLKKNNKIEEFKIQIKKITDLKNKIKKLQTEVNELEFNLNQMMMQVPNVPRETVPLGTSENDNLEIKKWGAIPKFNFPIKPHYELAEELNIIDFKRGVKISGARYHIYKNEGALLKRALVNFMLNNNISNNYREISPPLVVKSETLLATGQLPKFEKDLFKLENGSYLIPTAEVPLVGMLRNEIIDQKELPINITAYTPCFRSEAGSAGKDTRGIIRLHQFHKVEIVKVVHEENGIKELNNLLFHVEQLLQKLELPYRVIELCSADIGFSAEKTYDLEVWLPNQNCYREISSCSLCGTFQSRRMKMRFKDDSGKINYPATLNGSALAIDRTIAAIIENYQNEDGTITIPKVLVPYMGIKKIFTIS